MKYWMTTALALFGLIAGVKAQDDLFGNLTEKKPLRKGFIIGANGNFDIPAADMASRFGLSYRIGPSLQYKTLNNWLVGIKTDFIFGGRVTEDSLMHNLITSAGGIIDKTGVLKNAGVFERGFTMGIQGGKILTLGRNRSDNGILLLTGIGYMQHRIRILDRNDELPQLAGAYRKGYDRLTNGFYLEQFAGYSYISRNALINFYIGLNATFGFTEGRREFLYDVMRSDAGSRMDILFGIRGGWYIPIFRQKSEEIYY